MKNKIKEAIDAIGVVLAIPTMFFLAGFTMDILYISEYGESFWGVADIVRDLIFR